MMTPIAPIVSNTFLDDQNNWDDCWFPYNRLDHPKNWRRVVVSIRDFKIVDYGWLQRLKMCHARKTLMRCHRRASETACFPTIPRCGQDGKNHSH